MAARHHQKIRTLPDVVAVVVCLIFLGPVLWAAYSAFRTSRDLFTFPPNLSLSGFSLQNFQAVFASGSQRLKTLLVKDISKVRTEMHVLNPDR
jgi:ABC-type glycerol-3-phosphate transport system permease component